MKELIERLKQLIIEQNNVADKNTIYEAIQVLTSVKSESAEDKKQHAIGFKQYIDDIEMFSLRTLSDEERYNEYINTLNNK